MSLLKPTNLPFRKINNKGNISYICELGQVRLTTSNKGLLTGGPITDYDTVTGRKLDYDYSLSLPANIKLIQNPVNNTNYEIVSDPLSVLMCCKLKPSSPSSEGSIISVDHHTLSTNKVTVKFSFDQRIASLYEAISNMEGVLINDTFLSIPSYYVTNVAYRIISKYVTLEETAEIEYGTKNTNNSPYDSFVANSLAEMLSLTIKMGDRCYRTDTGNSMINITGINASEADWDILDLSNELTNTEIQELIDDALRTTKIHLATTSGNPHQVTKAEVGLGNVPNIDFTNDINLCTITRHSHLNSPILDNTTEPFTTEIKAAIDVNTAKVGITPEQAAAIIANTAKVGITPEQAAAIEVNTSKVGITVQQSADIVTAKNHTGIVFGNPHQVTKAEVGLGNVPNYDFTSEMQINNAKVGITTEQAANIAAANTHRNTVSGNPHNVTKAEVGLGNVPNIDTTNASNITSGTLPSSVLPPLAITNTFVTDNEISHLAFILEQGDVVVRTDLSKSFINITGVNTSMSDWQELLTPNDAVVLVNNKNGVVVLTTSDINEGSNLYYTEERVSANIDVALNTTNRHSHDNKAILDNVTAAFTIEQAADIITNNAKVGITTEQAANIAAANVHRATTIGNPHNVTKAEIGLGNVPNVDFTSRVETLEATLISENEISTMIVDYVTEQLRKTVKHLAGVRWTSIDYNDVKPLYSKRFSKYTTYWCNLQAFHDTLPFESLSATISTTETGITITPSDTIPLMYRVDIGNVDLLGASEKEVTFSIQISDNVGSFVLEQQHKIVIVKSKAVISASGLGADDKFYGVTFDNNAGVMCVGDSLSVGSGSNDVILLRYANNFDTQRNVSLGGANTDFFRDINMLSNGDLICVGYTNSYGSGNYDSLIAKFDTDLMLITKGVCGNTNNDYFYGVDKDSDNNVFAIGYTNSAGDNKKMMCLITKFDSNLNLISSKAFGITNKFDYGYDIKVLASGDIICVGKTDAVNANYSAFVYKFNNDLNFISCKLFTATGNDEFSAVNFNNNKIYCVGKTGVNGRLIVLDTNLNKLADKVFAYGSSCNLSGITIASNGDIVVIGSTTNASGISSGLVVTLNSDYTLKKAAVYGGSANDYLVSVAIDKYDNVVVVGYGSSDGQGSTDGLCLKWNALSGMPSGIFTGSKLSQLTYTEVILSITDGTIVPTTLTPLVVALSPTYQMASLTLVENMMTTIIDKIDV
jgi:hypothetical protein